MRRAATAAILALSFLLPTSASAQEIDVAQLGGDKPEVNAQIFRPMGHLGDILTTMGAQIPDENQWSVSALINYSKNPFVFVEDESDDAELYAVIGDQLTLDLMGTYSVMGWVDIGIAIPLHLYMAGDEGPGFLGLTSVTVPGPSSFAMGDIRLSPKIKILNREKDKEGFGLAGELRMSLPTGDASSLASDIFTFTPTIIADWEGAGLHAAANLGYRVRGANEYLFLEVDDEFVWRVGGSYDILGDNTLHAIGELYGQTSDFSSRNASNMEGMLGARYFMEDLGMDFTVGGGGGFLNGYGNTDYRFFLGARYAHPMIYDTDGDGLVDEEDKCPLKPEDKDGFEDGDGCPEPDNDLDGIPDTSDKCPMDPEDKDGHEDADGCPDPDNDGDGIPDTSDKCPEEPEDADSFQDSDGCPDPDNDKDRILDVNDKCPNKKEIYNGVDDEDGCPDESLAEVKEVDGKKQIVIHDKIYFDLGKATIKPESIPVMQAVLGILKANPDIKKCSVEGHTDIQGDRAFNMKLSDMRSASVKQWLIDQGIAAERLASKGFGPDVPLDPGKTQAAFAKNRRVEFIISDN